MLGSVEDVRLTRSEALDVLAALEAAKVIVEANSDLLMVLLEIEDASAVLIDRLWPNPEA